MAEELSIHVVERDETFARVRVRGHGLPGLADPVDLLLEPMLPQPDLPRERGVWFVVGDGPREHCTWTSVIERHGMDDESLAAVAKTAVRMYRDAHSKL